MWARVCCIMLHPPQKVCLGLTLRLRVTHMCAYAIQIETDTSQSTLKAHHSVRSPGLKAPNIRQTREPDILMVWVPLLWIRCRPPQASPLHFCASHDQSIKNELTRQTLVLIHQLNSTAWQAGLLTCCAQLCAFAVVGPGAPPPSWPAWQTSPANIHNSQA